MAETPPKIDLRDVDALLAQARAMAPVYTPEWKAAEDTGAGAALLKVFAKLAEGVIRRLNEVPTKNFVAFLEMIGIRLLPALPARVPLTFILSTGAREAVTIGERSQAAGTPPEGGDPVVFETERTILATPARLQAIFGIIPARDEIYNHTEELQGKTPTVAELFATTGKNLQEHSLFIGHEDLFQIKGYADIKLSFDPFEAALADSAAVLWQYCVGETKEKTPDWRDFARVRMLQNRLVLTKLDAAEIKKTKVNGVESCWIRGLVKKPLAARDPLARLVLAEIKVAATPLSEEAVIIDYGAASVAAGSARALTAGETGEGAEAGTRFSFTSSPPAASSPPEAAERSISARGIDPDAAFYNDLPLKLPATDAEPLTPYGPPPREGDVGVRPRQGDIFYLASQEALSKKGARITLIVDNAPGSVISRQSGRDLSIERVHGIGKAFATRLREAGVRTITDFLSLSLAEAADIVSNKQKGIPAERYLLKMRNMQDAAARMFLDRKTSLGIPYGSKIPGHDMGETGGAGGSGGGDRQMRSGESTQQTPILSWEYWNGAGWVGLRDVVDATNALTEAGQVFFTCPADLSPTKVIGQENYWIRVRIAFGDYGREEARIMATSPPEVRIDTSKIRPPVFYLLNISYSMLGEPPTHVQAVNNLQYVSGELPLQLQPFTALDDRAQSLYLGFDQPPTKGPISIFFSLKEQEYTDDRRPRVEWEYYRKPAAEEEGEWARMLVTDGTRNLTESGTVEFIGAEDFAPLGRFGRELYWIRAVDVENRFKSLREVVGEYAVRSPVVAAVETDAATVKKETRLQQNLITLLGDRVSAKLGEAFRTRLDTEQAAKLSSANVSGANVSSANVSSANVSRATTAASRRVAAGTGKQSSAISATTKGREERARAQVCVQSLGSLVLDFSVDTGLAEGALAPLVRGIYLNTAWAAQSETVNDEILGSSNGVADQSFTLTKLPVISEEIWIDELGSLTESERKAFVAGRSLEVDERKDDEGNPTEFRIRWQRVDDLAEASASARVYTIDRTYGEVQFGDGTHGMVPPIGRDNVRARYQAGGGLRGNVAAGVITGLRTTIPFVDRVTNPEAAGGGSDTELLEKALERGPRAIRHRGRAITVEDFEQLALEASQSVARVRALPTFNDEGDYETNWVTVLIVPASTEARPLPSPQLRQRVETYLRERAASVAVFPQQIKVTGAAYVEVKVAADIFPRRIDLAPAAESDANALVESFLHPLTGGYENRGWEFGRLPCLSDFYALLESIESIDHIENLSMTLQGMTPGGQPSGNPTVVTEEKPLGVEVPPYALVFSGEHRFGIKTLKII